MLGPRSTSRISRRLSVTSTPSLTHPTHLIPHVDALSTCVTLDTSIACVGFRAKLTGAPSLLGGLRVGVRAIFSSAESATRMPRVLNYNSTFPTSLPLKSPRVPNQPPASSRWFLRWAIPPDRINTLLVAYFDSGGFCSAQGKGFLLHFGNFERNSHTICDGNTGRVIASGA